MTSKIIAGILISLSLAACEQQSSTTITETTVDKDGRTVETTHQTISVSSGGDNSVAVGAVNGNVTISSNGNGNAIAIGDNSAASVIHINNGNGSINMNSTNGNNIYIGSDGKNSVTVGSVGNVTINSSSGSTTINQNSNGQNTVNISFTGKLVKIPLSKIKTINSTFNIEQKCSPDNSNYVLVDEGIQPYLNIKDGDFKLKNGSYNIKGNTTVQLFTTPLIALQIEHGNDVNLSCVDKNKFVLTNDSLAKININELNDHTIEINNDSNGKIQLNGNKVKQLLIKNDGIGDITASLFVTNAKIENNSNGVISLKGTDTLDAVNDGIGSINVESTNKVIQLQNDGIGKIHIGTTKK